MRSLLTLALATACSAALWALPQRATHGRLFPPEDLGILESPDRDHWQQPERIMDALRIADGSRVADLGAGGGWFTIRLARRVGQNGVVYAQDIQPQMIESIRRRVLDEGLQNVEFVLGTASDPKLPANLDAVLIVDTYTEFDDPITVLRHVARSLKPAGRVGVVDFKKDGAGGPGPPLEKRIDPGVIQQDALEAGLRQAGVETFLPYQYLLIFGR
jgi:ubiquinone/menaquinone biosynthesis C-methylase UbiE